MKNPFLHLVFLTIIVLAVAVLAWLFGVRRADETQAPVAFDHPWRRPAPRWISYGGDLDAGPPNSMSALVAANAILPKEDAIWLDVRMTSDGLLVLSRSGEFPAPAGQVGPERLWVDYEPGDRVRTAGVLALEDVLSAFPHRRWIWNLMARRPGLTEYVEKALKLHPTLKERVLFHSDTEGILKELHERNPLLLYGVSRARLTQLGLLASLGLAPLGLLPGDVLVVADDSTSVRSQFLSDAILSEANRRAMLIVAGPAHDLVDAQDLRRRGVNAILVERVRSFLAVAQAQLGEF